ncbi:transmembrane protein [Achlya hypogyna]|uniref:Transmembrane protein n=1 Tax=Achlya hypogyna TaxID=1202772 RepID=A0A1V9ZP24_ACHHY|nr:transmembrane protein [Achlya hypogyna]
MAAVGGLDATARPKGRGATIWEEYYPLLQPQTNYATLPSNNFFAPEVVSAYIDGVHAFLVSLFCLSTLSLTGLVLCDLFSFPKVCSTLCHLLWIVSPAVSAVALRRIVEAHLGNVGSHTSAAAPMWEVPQWRDLFTCYPRSSLMRLLVLSYCIPLFCQIAAYTLTAATRMVNPFNRSFVERAETVFSFGNADVKDGGLVFYVFYLVFAGVFWDPIPPARYDFGTALNCKATGCSWLLLAVVQEIGWSGALYPALEIVCGHSAFLASVATGLVWALWHWPFVVAEHCGFIPEGSGYAIVTADSFEIVSVLCLFTALLVGARLTMCWIQGKTSHAIWSSAVYHASHNLFIVSVFGQLMSPLFEKLAAFPYFSGQASVCLVLTTWFSTCILSQLFRTPYMKLFGRKRRYYR